MSKRYERKARVKKDAVENLSVTRLSGGDKMVSVKVSACEGNVCGFT